jgi:hypothetical protein
MAGSDDNQPISHSAAGASPINVRFTTPLARTMMTALDFIAVLAKAVKRRQEINLLVGSTNGDKNMSCRQINSLIKAVKDEKNNQNDEKDRQRRGCCCLYCLESTVMNQLMQPHHKGSDKVPADNESEKAVDCQPLKQTGARSAGRSPACNDFIPTACVHNMTMWGGPGTLILTWAEK